MSGPFTEYNRKVVSTLYRQSLRLSKSWINRRDLWRTTALEIRQQFDQNKNISDHRQALAVIEKAKETLKKYQHPDPIIPSWRPGGTKYERNIPPPQQEKVHDEGW
ncbi:hypothetical protein TRVA0_005S03488 [Trichomonascus vanleenenianus]|uniref:NADH dehydrogenase [ubiquinone] 1 beta subcomplex subunit 9 n=1 Tax=Trichomonascus vanleenenianus TaxID=2268995 RepID=UPI003EC9F7E2